MESAKDKGTNPKRLSTSIRIVGAILLANAVLLIPNDSDYKPATQEACDSSDFINSKNNLDSVIESINIDDLYSVSGLNIVVDSAEWNLGRHWKFYDDFSWLKSGNTHEDDTHYLMDLQGNISKNTHGHTSKYGGVYFNDADYVPVCAAEELDTLRHITQQLIDATSTASTVSASAFLPVTRSSN